MLNERGCLVLVDFGFAKVVEQKVMYRPYTIGGTKFDHFGEIYRLKRRCTGVF